MSRKLLAVPLLLAAITIIASYPMSDSCNEVLLTPPSSPPSGYAWEDHRIIAISWGSQPPEPGHTDPDATVVYQAETVERIPPKDIDAKWAEKMKAPDKKAPKKVRRKQKRR